MSPHIKHDMTLWVMLSLRWLWDVGNVKNELIRGETGWSTFEEREAKSMVKWMLKVVFEENRVSEIGRACLIELGCKSRWWS